MRYFNIYFPFLVYGLSLFCELVTLFKGVDMGLFPMPPPGTDQLSMLTAAGGLCQGCLPAGPYGYSPAYTVFLSVLALFSCGNIFVMRMLQAAVCALIPVVVYKIARRVRLGREAAQIASLAYCFYGPAVLISLDFLREAPLSLCFAAFVYYLLKSYTSRRCDACVLAGFFAGLCVLGRENFLPIILLPLVFPLVGRWRRRARVGRLALYAAAVILVVSPVLVYNSLRFGSCSIVPGHVGNVLAAHHGQEASEKAGAAIVSIAEKYPKQMYKFISSYELPNSLSFYAHRDVIDFLQALPIPFNLLVALAGVCVILRWRSSGVLCVALMVLAYAATMSFFEMFYRFRIPVAPLVCVLSGGGVALLARSLRSVKGGVIAVGVAVFVLATYTNPESLRTANERLAVVNVLIANGKLVKAENHLVDLASRSVRAERQWNALVASLLKQGADEGAERARRRQTEAYRLGDQPPPSPLTR